MPNFGIVLFSDVESVQRVMNAKPILLYGAHRLNVEEKKFRRDSPGGFFNRDRHDIGNSESWSNFLTRSLKMSMSENNSKSKSESLQSVSSDSQQLFVGNLPHICSEEELAELFSKFGKVCENVQYLEP